MKYIWYKQNGAKYLFDTVFWPKYTSNDFLSNYKTVFTYNRAYEVLQVRNWFILCGIKRSSM